MGSSGFTAPTSHAVPRAGKADLPSGNVTFLFTDIEGSTRLWERDPAAMRVAVERHNAILDEAIAAHGGSHFKSIGDAYAVAFADAPAAVAVAATAQRALAAEPWGKVGELRVRMAIHAGEATPVGGDYLAPLLNRLSRLLATGYGGQVLLSEEARRLVREQLPDGATLKDLGRHRLRDLLEPLDVAQLVLAGLRHHFPPLKSLERHPTNLPVQPNPLVGREQELAAVKVMLGRNDVRLVTLTGMGGTGKTRLGLQVAAELLEAYDDGTFFVDLAPLTDASLVLPTIAETLGVREASGQSLRNTLVAHLVAKHLLLVLDNFEQVVDAAAEIADLLRATTSMELLITSRARLGLRAEHEYPVGPLQAPNPARLPPLPALAEIAAVALFVQRATAARHDFALTATNAAPVAEICARLDGLPLAIELAAARVMTLSPQAILERLDSRLMLLTGGARDLPERQRTLRATIDWSHDLLSAGDRTLFRRLAVFAGGFGLESAEVVATAVGELGGDVLDGVTTLVSQSLLRQAGGLDGEPRFTMLETLREFGLERLAEAGEVEATRRAHAEWCLALAKQAEPHLSGPEQGVWLARLESEHDNLRAALAAPDDAGDRTLRLAAALWRFWDMRGHFSEGRRWLEQALAGSAANHPATVARADALNGSGVLAYLQGDYARAVTRYQESLAIRRQRADKAGVAASLNNLGLVAEDQGDHAGAVALYEESLAVRRELGDQLNIAASLNNLGVVAEDQGDYARATKLHEEALAIMRKLGNQRGVAVSLSNLGRVAHEQGDDARSVVLLEECLEILRALGDRNGYIVGLEDVAGLAASVTNAAPVVRLLSAAAVLREELGVPTTPVEHARNERALTAARASLSEPALIELQASGRALGAERAIAEAITVLREVATTLRIPNQAG